METEVKCNRELPKLEQEFGLGLVAANDVHFLERAAHAALMPWPVSPHS